MTRVNNRPTASSMVDAASLGSTEVTTRSAVRLFILSIAFIVLVIPSCAGAVGVSASPSQLELSLIKGEEITVQLLVGNPSTGVSVFEVYPDEFKSAITIMPSSFILESGDQRKVNVRVRLKEIGVFKTNISILAKPLAESAFSAASGIKIPVRLEVTAGRRGYTLAAAALSSVEVPLAALLAVIALLVFTFLRSRRYF